MPITGILNGAATPLLRGDIVVLREALVRELVDWGAPADALAYLLQPFSNLVAFESDILILSRGNALPKPVIIGAEGRLPPTESMVEGVRFWESVKGMLVKVKTPLAITPRVANYVYTVTDDGYFASGLTKRGTLNVSPNDFNPESVLLVESGDNGISITLPDSNVGGRFDNGMFDSYSTNYHGWICGLTVTILFSLSTRYCCPIFKWRVWYSCCRALWASRTK
jgi:hypothetical protein